MSVESIPGFNRKNVYLGVLHSIYHYFNVMLITNVPAEAFFSEG